MKHKHHIIPKHAGGSDELSNLTELTIEEHAEAHRQLYLRYGHWKDKFAWLGLSKLLTKEEFDKEFFKQCALEGNKKRWGSISDIKRKPGQSNKTPPYPKGIDGRKVRKSRYWYSNGKECGQF